MENGFYLWAIHFVPLKSNLPHIFGISEYLTAMAFMVIAWTIADVRYQFRINIAPIPLKKSSYFIFGIIGLLTLLTDLWQANNWFVPNGDIMSPATWEAILAGLLLSTFLLWAWFAFIKPPIYGKLNSKRFALSLYKIIVKGSNKELSILSDELILSIKSIIKFAENIDKYKQNENKTISVTDKVAYAGDILRLIADRRFCCAMVASSPGIIGLIFSEISQQKKYGVPISIFAKNIVTEAIKNKNSFIYHESSFYDGGLIGHIKPITHSMFSNYIMVSEIDSMLDIHYKERETWDNEQLEAYIRIVLIVTTAYIEAKQTGQHSYVLFRAHEYILWQINNLWQINKIESIDSNTYEKLRLITDYITDTIDILEKQEIPKWVKLKMPKNEYIGTYYDQVASMIFKVIGAASYVKSPVMNCWAVQHNSVWGVFFNFGRMDSPVGKMIKYKVRRLMFKEIKRMDEFPNYVGARIIGFCLNIFGIHNDEQDYHKDHKALKKVILAWVKKNYAFLHHDNPRLAEHCFVDGFSYDAVSFRIVQTLSEQGMRKETKYLYFNVDPYYPEKADNN